MNIYDTSGDMLACDIPQKWPAKDHIVPAYPCPICANDVDFVDEGDSTYTIECPHCGLVFGLPYGYSSRLDLVHDWNNRAQIQIGWWVIFTEVDETGKLPNSYFLTTDQAQSLIEELNTKKFYLEPVFIIGNL